MGLISSQLYSELEILTQKIEKNTAKLTDYKRYEIILRNAGLPREYIFSYLRRAGFNNWDEFFFARNRKAKDNQEILEAVAIGGIIGLGIGLLLSSISND